jgi:hypothetical protein
LFKANPHVEGDLGSGGVGLAKGIGGRQNAGKKKRLKSPAEDMQSEARCGSEEGTDIVVAAGGPACEGMLGVLAGGVGLWMNELELPVGMSVHVA